MSAECFGDPGAPGEPAGKLTSRDLARLRVIDEIIPEPPGGAHRDPRETANMLKTHLLRQLRTLQSINTKELLDRRYQRFRQMGHYFEGGELKA